MTIAATNHQGLLDPALWRRFDEIVFFDMPGAAAIEWLLRQPSANRNSPGARSAYLAEGLVGLSHADVERIARDAAKEMLLNRTGASDANGTQRKQRSPAEANGRRQRRSRKPSLTGATNRKGPAK